MEIIEFIPAGFETVSALLLLLGVDSMTSEYIKERINNLLKNKRSEVKSIETVTEMLTWILDDKFNKDTQKFNNRVRNAIYLNELENLKNEMIGFYLERLEVISKNDSEINKSCDIHSAIGEYALQIMRLRMVIEPEINLLTNPFITNKEKGERTLYLTAKAFWVADDGKKTRKFTKSLGRMDQYSGGREGKAAKEEAVRRLQPILWEEYKTTYP